MNCTWPASRSLSAAAPPRYGTCTISVWVITLKSSPPTWPGDPFADEALVSLPGFFFASAISSFTDVMPDFGDTASSRWPRVSSATGWKSFSMLYGSFATMFGLIASAPTGPMPSV